MPTRKQRRRRAKEHRHEYVWEDEEGNELESEEVPARKGGGAQSSRSAPTRSGREAQPPSWRRTLKRGLVFAPVMFIVVMLLSNDLTLVEQITQAAFVVAIFIPFSYFLDGVLWRTFKKREARRETGKQ